MMYNSAGSSSSVGSDNSDCFTEISPTCQDMEQPLPLLKIAPRDRKTSVTSVSTDPGEDAYVMVLQNKQGVQRDVKHMLSNRDMCDVTFLVGKERQPVYGLRSVIANRCRILYEIITSYEDAHTILQKTPLTHVKKTLSKFNKFSCVCARRHQQHRTRRHNNNHVNRKLTIPMEKYDYNSFQRLILYIHCGTLTVDPLSVIGLLNASAMFGIPEVRLACWDFALGCTARDDNLKDLLESSKTYADHEITKDLLKSLRRHMTNSQELRHRASTLERINDELEDE